MLEPYLGPVYLHFLNRELRRSVGAYSYHYFLRALLFSAGITVGTLFAPLSAVIEDLDRISSVERRALELLIANDHLSLVSDAPSLSDFIEERQRLYSFDSSRYRIYFDDSSLPEWLEPSVFKEISATTDLEISILTVLDNHATGRLASLSLSDIQDVENSLRDRAGKGITMSLFSGTLSPASDAVVGRFISTEYIRHYTSFLYADIITGLPKLQTFDVVGTHFPLLDVPTWRTVLASVDAAQLVGPITLDEYDVQQYLDELVGIRSSTAHLLLVAEVQSLINGIVAYNTLESGLGNWSLRGRLEAHVRSIAASSPFSDASVGRYRHLTDDVLYSIVDRIQTLRGTAIRREAHAPDFLAGEHILAHRNYDEKRAEVFEKFVFVSYVSEDVDKVSMLCDYLRSNGLPVWQDRSKLTPGERWRTSIRRAITQDACAFVACFSNSYIGREHSYMNEELAVAIEEIRKRPHDRSWFIPVRFDDVPVPDRDIGAGETLRDIHQLDMFDNWDLSCERLAIALKSIFQT